MYVVSVSGEVMSQSLITQKRFNNEMTSDRDHRSLPITQEKTYDTHSMLLLCRT